MIVDISSRGHVYFTLKDKEQEAVLPCVMWKGQYAMYGIKLAVGMEIVASGKANIYAPWGKLSFVASAIELVGEGALKKKYEELKKKLTAEGLFAEERKRSLPDYPRKIGVITSKQGAVIHDFMNNLGRYGFQVTCIDSRVEGAEALPDLYAGLKTLKKKDLDVIVIMRGGGSLQSLAAFDAEALVREVASSPIPVIAAIGHHEDVPLCALVADKAVSTPTAAANELNKTWDRATELLTNASQRILYEFRESLSHIKQTIETDRVEILNRFRRILDSFSQIASQVKSYLSEISTALEYLRKELDDNTQKILKGITQAIAEKDLEINKFGTDRILRPFGLSLEAVTQRIDTQSRLIAVYNPMRQLSLGYSLVRGSKHNLVKSIKDVTIGEEVSILTHDGMIDSEVKGIKEKENDKTN